MSGPYILPATGSKYNVFERLGHPGKYTETLRYTGGQLDLTGSNYGYGSLIVKTAGSATASLSKVHGGTSSIIYVLKRQQ